MKQVSVTLANKVLKKSFMQYKRLSFGEPFFNKVNAGMDVRGFW